MKTKDIAKRSKDLTIKVKVQTKFIQLLFVANAPKIRSLDSQFTKNMRTYLFSKYAEEFTNKISL